MPLRQTLLSFAGSTGLLGSRNKQPRPTPSRTATTSTIDDADTIIVATPDDTKQLPTPSESAEDVSSQGTDIVSLQKVPKGRAKRVSRRVTKNQSQDALLDTTEERSGPTRAVSGETLVNHVSMSQTSLMKEGIAALNLPWSMSQVFDTGSKAELLRSKATEQNASTDTVDTLTPEEVEAEKERAEKAAAKRVKMDENKKIREAKWKAEDDKATRRSSRASMLTKAGDVVSDLASTVLGKRKDRVSELRGSLRPMSAIGPPRDDAVPDAKRRRFSDSVAPTATTIAPRTSSKKLIRRAKDKKWLNSGLFAGQPRTFNPTLSESKNKRKSSAPSQPEKENTVLPLPMFAGERLLKQGRDFKLPFDVFSPLPAGQPKPDEWRKSNKNTFVGDASQEWRISKFIEHSTCMCSPAVGCDADCMNRYMYYECDERNCNLTAEQCGNRAFEGLKHRTKKGSKYNIGVEVIKTVDRGNGVRSNRTFEPNQIIVEYTGEIVTQEECERRMHEVYSKNEVKIPTLSFLPLSTVLTSPVLLPHALRPKYDHRRHHPWLHRPLCQPLLRPELSHGEMDRRRSTTYGAFRG
jgi:[histone H3]-lysine4 N-trimethyltransferase ASH1L